LIRILKPAELLFVSTLLFCKKILMTLNNLVEPRTIQSSDSHSLSASASSIPERDWKRRDPHTIKFAGRGEKKIKEYKVDEFRRVTEVEYLPHLEFQDEKTFRRIRKQCTHASKNGYIDSKRKWLGALYAKQIRCHYVADVSIRWIDETLKYGLFAEEDISAWDFIGEYTGLVRRHYPILGKMNDYCFLYPTSRYFFGKHLIDGEDGGNEIRYANHSDDPNSEVTGIFSDDLFHMILRAIKDIPPHTQITYDYGARYWKSRPRIPNATESMDH